jgi:hypothetical protein
MKTLLASITFAIGTLAVVAQSPTQLHIVKQRASLIDSRAKEHPEINFVFKDAKGKTLDLQHAVVDTRLKSEGKLVIWLMQYNAALFERIASYGLHGIQVHYANQWFSELAPNVTDGLGLGKIRLEAATGEDHSPLVSIPKSDGMMGRSFQFVMWLAKEHPEGKWGQFLTDDRKGLRWDKVIIAGASHGSTTAARFALHQKVDRVVMLCGPRDQHETWQGFPSATPSERFFGFSHVLDGGWTGHHYCRSWEMLGLHKHGPIVDVDTLPAPYGNTRRLTTAFDVKNDANRAHSSVLPGGAAYKDAKGQYQHEAVWKYLFTHPIDRVGHGAPLDPTCRVAPMKNAKP